MTEHVLPAAARFLQSHEYLIPAKDTAVVGISHYAAEQLGDIVFVELPPVGTRLVKGQSFGVVESVKAVSDLYAPLDGTVLGVNEALNDEPALVGEDPYERGWMLKVKPDDAAQLLAPDLLSAADYEAFTGEH